VLLEQVMRIHSELPEGGGLGGVVEKSGCIGEGEQPRGLRFGRIEGRVLGKAKWAGVHEIRYCRQVEVVFRCEVDCIVAVLSGRLGQSKGGSSSENLSPTWRDQASGLAGRPLRAAFCMARDLRHVLGGVS
jgi:hypothetical protein